MGYHNHVKVIRQRRVGDPFLLGDTVIIDTRAGKAQDLQSLSGSTAVDTALTHALMQTTASGNSTVNRFLHNNDLGVNCFGHDWMGFATMVFNQAVVGSGSTQTVNVIFNQANNQFGTNKVVGAGWGTPTLEAVKVTGVDFTHGTVSGKFLNNHANGDQIAVGMDFDSRIGISAATLGNPRHLFVQWKQYMGRTANDGGGLGTTGSFMVYNGYIDQNSIPGQNFDINPTNSNAGRKVLLMLRQIYDQGALDRLNFLWPGSNGSSGGLLLDSDGHYTNNPAAGSIYNPIYLSVGSSSYNPAQGVGLVVTHTVEVLCESSLLAGDGYVKITSVIPGVGTFVQRSQNCCVGPENIANLQILPTFNSPQQPQTEYTWDYIVWTRAWSGTVPPQQAPYIPGSSPQVDIQFVSATSTTLTFNIQVPSSAPDTVRFYAGAAPPNWPTSSSVYGVGGTSGGAQIGSDISLSPSDAGTTKQVTVTGLTPSTTYTGIGYAFGLSGTFGVQSGGIASASTTA